MPLPKSVQNLIDEFSKLPGIGPKTAARLAFYLLTKPTEEVKRFGSVLAELKDQVVECQRCFTIADNQICSICADRKRDESILAVVVEPLDVIALERTGFKGHYFVIGGVISPIDGIGPEDLRIAKLLDRLVSDGTIKEVILATDPSLEGEATAMYIAKEVEKRKNKKEITSVRVTRLARGLPIGSELEYADELTLSRALEGRKEY
jgi:recombination protein RecR